jgi:protocatechuate 3,4-dioxygenase beta subunit
MRYAALLFLWPLAASAQTGEPMETSAIEGRVLNAATGEPVEKVSLFLMRTDSTQISYDWTRSYGASSDSVGRFAIRNIAPGRYRLRASRNGFVTLEYGARASRRDGIVLDLDRPQQLKNVSLRLVPHGVIAGRVLDTDGEPMARVQIQLLRSQYVNGKKLLTTTNTTYTNDLGEYRWPGLTPGKYYIYAENVEGLPPATVANEEYVPVYYPDATNTAEAIPVEVTAGLQVRPMDMVLRKAPTSTVKGRVVIELPDAHGIPSVRCFPKAGHNNSSAGSFRFPSAIVNAAGEFEFRSLTPGSYTVVAEISKGGLGFSGQTTVDVGGSSMEGVVVAIGNGVSVTGRIRVDGEAKLNLHNARLRLRRGGPAVDSILLGSTYRVAQDRTFKIENLDPDRYGFLIEGLPDGFYIESIRVGGIDTTYSGVDLKSGAPGDVDIFVSPKAGLVSGGTQDPNTNQPAPGVTVVLVPKEQVRRTIPEFYQQVTSDQHGRFMFKNVVPGEYKVYAWEDVESSAWMDPEFMKPLEDNGESVTVGESAQANVRVSVIPADLDKEKPK